MTDDELRNIFQRVKTIALVGASPNPDRPSHDVMHYLLDHGYKVFPVNPGQAGKEILRQLVYASLADIPEEIDMVDVFRASNAVPAVVDEVLSLKTLPQVLWLQLDISNAQAEAKAEVAGIQVVRDMCTKQQHRKLFGTGH